MVRGICDVVYIVSVCMVVMPASAAETHTRFGINYSLTEGLGPTTAVPIRPNAQGVWLGELAIDEQSFHVNFDTGSASLWVVDKNCMTEGCSGAVHRYSGEESKKQREPFRARYLDGTEATGPVYKDKVTVGGFSAEGQLFGSAMAVTDNFAMDSPGADGIFGLGLPSPHNIQTAPFMFYLPPDVTRLFSLWFSHEEGEILIGGIDSQRVNEAALEYHTVKRSDDPDVSSGAWELSEVHWFVYSDVPIASGSSVVIDSGTEWMYGPAEEVDKIYAALGGKRYEGHNVPPGHYIFPLDTELQVYVSFGIGSAWYLDPSTVRGSHVIVDNEKWWQGTILAYPESKRTGWILGVEFMKNLYTVFDMTDGADKPRIGFAYENAMAKDRAQSVREAGSGAQTVLSL